jgi:hypothetical protein
MKHKQIVFSALAVFFSNFVLSQVGIGTITPEVAAQLDVTSVNKGFLPPRMTNVQKNAIISPVAGLTLWCTDCGSLGEMQVYNGSTWTNMIGGSATPGPFICGSSTVSFNYNGSTVIYGTVVGTSARCWLDRNLGASQVALSSTDNLAYGHLFQWGRGDDGHQIRTSSITSNLSSTDLPGNSNFITSISDWRSPQNNNLWQGLNGINNPCPNGFRLPTETEFNNERLSWSTNNALGGFNSPLKLTLSGTRLFSDASVYEEGVTGKYWLSNTSGNSARGFSIVDISAYFAGSNRAQGRTVRCIKD